MDRLTLSTEGLFNHCHDSGMPPRTYASMGTFPRIPECYQLLLAEGDITGFDLQVSWINTPCPSSKLGSWLCLSDLNGLAAHCPPHIALLDNSLGQVDRLVFAVRDFPP